MLILETRATFDRDLKALRKKHWNTDKLKAVIAELLENHGMFGRFHDHALSGNLVGFRELHIEQNILLMYQVENGSLILTRLGTHDDLFG
ncbi:MAG: type II toxin-antitoxin system YafQ family toxin [Rickettsiales bacterium]|jgi:mRNA interferase YafQ|nr:type II toxin-antitoxin system YafQ family toxin [Rickettsiales bacterium]